jgi:hypothetical protein
LLVLNGHGQGAFDNEGDEQDTGEASASNTEGTNASGNGHSVSVATIASSITSPEVSTGSSFPIEENVHPAATILSLLPDDSSHDALTSRELKEALDGATEILGVDKIDVLGMDACLMSMIEIAKQANNSAALMVASEESIPNKSWPYGAILQRLTAEPTMSDRELCKIIVDEYLAFYKIEDSGPVTLSACDLGKTDNMVAQVRILGNALRENLQNTRIRRALIEARGNTQSFLVSDYVDLYHLCEVLRDTLESARFEPATVKEVTAFEKLKAACLGVMEAIKKQGNDETFVFHSDIEAGSSTENRLANSHGVSIYFPLILPLYRNLEFSKTALWDSFLFDYMNTVFRQPAVPSAIVSKSVSVTAATSPTLATPNSGGIQT